MKKYKLDYDELVFLLKLKKMSAKDLAELVGIKRQTIYYWKSKGTTLDNVRVIAYYLGVETDRLLITEGAE